MPLLTWRYPCPSLPLTNQQITFMHVSCDPETAFDTKNKNTDMEGVHSDTKTVDKAVFGLAPMRYQRRRHSSCH
jgi:hypothetical protein